MTTPPPDPDPDRTPGLEPGGGVRPGDTPPDSGSTSGLSHPQPMPGRAVPVWATVLLAVFVLGALGLVIAQLTGIAAILW